MVSDRWPEMEPNRAKAHEYMGEAYVEQGKCKQAEYHLGILKELRSPEAVTLKAYIRKHKR